MDPTLLRARGAVMLARRTLKWNRAGWFLLLVADETELGLWPRPGAVPHGYPVPGTARYYIARAAA